MASNRVMAIATVHKQLHLTGNVGKWISASSCAGLRKPQTHRAGADHVDRPPDPVKLGSDAASGSMVAELVTNSFKYAYPVGEHGTSPFLQNAGGWSLKVSDQGRGLPENCRQKGFGMQVVKAFVRRLNATMTVSSRPGHTAFEITNVAPLNAAV